MRTAFSTSFEGPKVTDEHRLQVRASIELGQVDPLWIVWLDLARHPVPRALKKSGANDELADYSASRYAMQERASD